MKAQNKEKTVKKTPILLLFAALGALFGSGAIIGVTVLTSPALGWQIFAARLGQYLICFGVLFFAIWGYGSIMQSVAFFTLPVACVACGVRTVIESAKYVDGLSIALVFCALALGCVAASAWATARFSQEQKPAKPYAPTVFSILLCCAAAALSLALFIKFRALRTDSLQTDAAQAEIGQMLYYIKHSGLPFTTVVNGAPQNYLTVQFAPLWYLLLPVYAVFGGSLQAVGIALYALMLSAAVPLWRICKKAALSPMVTCALCTALMLCPLLVGGGVGGGTLSMLALPLLLWVADTALGKRPFLALIPLLLGLCISLEVTLWLTFLCLYLALCAKPERKKAAWLCTGVAAAALIATIAWLAICRSPALTGLLSGIGLQLAPKLRFLALLFIPTAILPFFCKQKSALVLLVPFVLCHLVANASVYSGVFTAYAFPAIACLALLCARGAGSVRLSICKIELGRALPAFALCASMLLCTPYVMLANSLYTVEEQELLDADTIRKALEKLPQNASVTASDSLLCELSARTWLFSLGACPEQPATNVIVLDLREDMIPSDMEDYDVQYYQSLGYTLRSDLGADGLVAVLFK